jgi:hypothetical protein
MQFSLLPHIKQFLSHEVPTILSNMATALKKAQFPSSTDEIWKMNQSDWIKLCPVLACVLTATAIPFCLLFNDVQDKCRPRENLDVCFQANFFRAAFAFFSPFFVLFFFFLLFLLIFRLDD